MLWLTSAYISMYRYLRYLEISVIFATLSTVSAIHQYVAIICLFFLMAFHWLETGRWLRICFDGLRGFEHKHKFTLAKQKKY